MKHRELVALYRGLDRLGSLTGVKFAYAVSRNLSLLKPVMESIDKSIEPSAEFSEYDKARIKLAEEHAKKDEKGKPIIEEGNYIMENDEAWQTAFEALKAQHAEVIAKREAQIKEYNELLELENPMVSLHKVKLADVPQGITVVQMHSIKDIIEE